MLAYASEMDSVDAMTPWQWSVNAGAGVQYQLLPHVNAYFEPRLQYYIPTGSPVEIYRTKHPLDLLPPFGIRFTW